MGKAVSTALLTSAALVCLLFEGCGSNSSTRIQKNEIPAAVSMTPAPDVSLELGRTQVFTPSATNSAGTTLQQNFTFQSSNPAIVTIASNGDACAGTWDSLTVPAVCTPGATGVAQVTAQANGVLSPPVNIYVHQHITNITVSKVPNQPATLSTTCLTRSAPLLGPGPESQLYEVFAYNVTPKGMTDITSTVDPFTWQAVPLPGQTSGTTSVTLTSAPANSPQCLKGLQGQCFNQEVATAATPGATEFIASAGGVNSQPVPFTTCPVQSIKVTPANGSSNTTFVVGTGTSTTLNAVAYDSLNLPLIDVPLTWSASDPVSVGAAGSTSTVYSSVGAASAPAAGGGSVTVSCTPPGCNGGITPSFPIYSAQAFGFTVRSGSTPASPTAYATTTACNNTTQACSTRIVPITRGSSTAPFTAGSSGGFPFAPNSVKYDFQGSNAYFGVNSTSLGTQGLMVFSGSSASSLTTAAGKVLAVSPDGATVILSDTADSPSRVFVCTSCNTANRSATAFLLPNALAAAFSPDSLKAYIVSGSSCPGTSSTSCLMIYSKLDAPQFVQLTNPATDVAFIGNGILGYVAGPAGSAALATCDHPSSAGPLTPVAINADLLRPLPDGQSAIALTPPNIQTVTWPAPPPNNPPKGCVPPRGNLDISTSVVGPPINLGAGSFTPTQFLISADGTMAYILGQVQQSVSFPITSATCALNSAGTGCTTPYTTYTYDWTSGPTVEIGMNITVSGMPAADNGTFPVVGVSGPAPSAGGFSGTFTVANPASVPAPGQIGTAAGNETLKLDFILVYNIQSQTSSNISLTGSAVPLSASLSPSGDLLFVGADDGQVHVVNTASLQDTQTVTLTFPQSSLCLGPGSPATSLQSLAAVISANQDSTAGTTTFAYSLTQGPPIAVGNIVKVAGMADPGNNGTFVATSVGTGTFTAVNPIGATATSQSGSASAGLTCNPDLVVVKP